MLLFRFCFTIDSVGCLCVAADREVAERFRLVHDVRRGGAGAMDGAKTWRKAYPADRYDTGTDTCTGTDASLILVRALVRILVLALVLTRVLILICVLVPIFVLVVTLILIPWWHSLNTYTGTGSDTDTYAVLTLMLVGITDSGVGSETTDSDTGSDTGAHAVVVLILLSGSCIYLK